MAEREANVRNGADETWILLYDNSSHPCRATVVNQVGSIKHSFTHRRLTVLEDVPLLAVVRAAEGAALVELDEHRVGGVAGAVDVDAVLVVRVSWQEKYKWVIRIFSLLRPAMLRPFYLPSRSCP